MSPHTVSSGFEERWKEVDEAAQRARSTLGRSDLKDYFLMDGEFGDDVCQQQVPTVFASRIHTSLGEQTGPCKGHQTAQLAIAVLVVVMDVVGGMLHQERGILQEVDPQGVQHVSLFLRVQDLTGRRNSL